MKMSLRSRCGVVGARCLCRLLLLIVVEGGLDHVTERVDVPLAVADVGVSTRGEHVSGELRPEELEATHVAYRRLVQLGHGEQARLRIRRTATATATHSTTKCHASCSRCGRCRRGAAGGGGGGGCDRVAALERHAEEGVDDVLERLVARHTRQLEHLAEHCANEGDLGLNGRRDHGHGGAAACRITHSSRSATTVGHRRRIGSVGCTRRRRREAGGVKRRRVVGRWRGRGRSRCG